MNPEEQTYIKRILRGETELYGYFLDTYGQRIFTLVQQIVSNREDAEDLTQDIFVKAFESLKQEEEARRRKFVLVKNKYDSELKAAQDKIAQLQQDLEGSVANQEQRAELEKMRELAESQSKQLYIDFKRID